MNDKLILHQCHFSCHVGCTALERAEAQTIIIDVELFFNMHKSVLSDNLEDTINYALAHVAIQNVVENREFNLIETMAEAVAEKLLATFPIEKICIRLQKPKYMRTLGGAWVGVEITRP